MSNVVNVSKNGSLSKAHSNVNFPSWSNWLDDILNKDRLAVIDSQVYKGDRLPKVNIKETAETYVVEMAAPGLKKSDFQITLENEVISIFTEVNEENNREEENYKRREFAYSSFKRTFSLPETVDDEKIVASYVDGILNVVLPKKEEAKQKPVRSIKIS